MELLNILMENEGIQSYLNENQEILEAGTEMFNEFPQELKSYIQENLNQFIDESVEKTLENIVVFTEAAVHQFLDEVTNQMVVA